ncbi:hypothetical protein [Sansalvadorimonas verongulae]|uniref:hypothetical protein n=1 Tax=Sansalvadorimonas verongulae TaxID=2172824 RepID=UPI0012BD66A3|nr:hypothetical protein [Sansalvadorimonas verongulae]
MKYPNLPGFHSEEVPGTQTDEVVLKAFLLANRAIIPEKNEKYKNGGTHLGAV